MSRKQHLFYTILFLIIIFMVMFWRISLILLIGILFLLPSIMKESDRCADVKNGLDNMNLKKYDYIIVNFNNGKQLQRAYISHDDFGVLVEFVKVKYGEIKSIEKVGYNKYSNRQVEVPEPIFREFRPMVNINVEV